MVRSAPRRPCWSATLRRGLVASLVAVGLALPALPSPATQAAPLDQGFVCNEAGIAGSGIHRCYDFTTEVLTPAVGNVAELVHDCGGGWVIIMHGVHRSGTVMPITFDDFSANNQVWTVRVRNQGPNVGQFWLTGRCRTAAPV